LNNLDSYQVELGMLSVVRKLVKDAIHPRRSNFGGKKFSLLQAIQITNDYLWFSTIFRG
jgi:hypothetical protein